MVMQPTLEMAEAWSTDRLAPMVRDTPCLTAKIADPKSRDSGNKLLQKRFAGGQLVIVGANSPASLASRPIRVVLADEVDRYPASAGVEGDPLDLAYKRTNNFWNRRKLAGSTPTIAGASRIEAKFLESDQRYFFVPCPHCGERQVLKWEQVRWEKTAAGAHRPQTSMYWCSECGCAWDDGERWAAVLKGEWRATAPFNGIAGFHIWEAYSSWVKLAETVTAFLEKRKTTEGYKTWTNTALGLPWVEKGEAPDWQRLFERRSQELRLGEICDRVGVLTAGADVQRQPPRIEVDVWGWGPGLESFLVEHRVFHGDPAAADVWKELDELLRTEWGTPAGRRLKIQRLAVDSSDGWSTTHVYAYARRNPVRVMAVKGEGGFNASQLVTGPTWVDCDVNGRRIARGAQKWGVAVSVFKAETYAWLKLDMPKDGDPFPAGYIHLPAGTDEEWIKQLVAEQLVTIKNKRTGFAKREWQKTRDRNEAIDCRVYARAAAYRIGIDGWSAARWARLLGRVSSPASAARQLTLDSASAEPQSPAPAASATARRSPTRGTNPLTGRARGSFLGR